MAQGHWGEEEGGGSLGSWTLDFPLALDLGVSDARASETPPKHLSDALGVSDALALKVRFFCLCTCRKPPPPTHPPTHPHPSLPPPAWCESGTDGGGVLGKGPGRGGGSKTREASGLEPKEVQTNLHSTIC